MASSGSGDHELYELRRKKLRLECSKLELEIERLPLECAKLELQIQQLQRDLLANHNNIWKNLDFDFEKKTLKIINNKIDLPNFEIDCSDVQPWKERKNELI